MLAGISVEYYTRLERGNAVGVSEDVLECVARALQLDEAERAHLFDLVRATTATSRPPRRRPTQERVRPTVQRILDSITAPAYVRNSRLDLLAANTLGYALYTPVFEETIGIPNMSRFIFLNPRANEFFHDWESIANDAVCKRSSKTTAPLRGL
jgi:transcriptional regulator with XRE-family HTH domain